MDLPFFFVLQDEFKKILKPLGDAISEVQVHDSVKGYFTFIVELTNQSLLQPSFYPNKQKPLVLLATFCIHKLFGNMCQPMTFTFRTLQKQYFFQIGVLCPIIDWIVITYIFTSVAPLEVKPKRQLIFILPFCRASVRRIVVVNCSTICQL